PGLIGRHKSKHDTTSAAVRSCARDHDARERPKSAAGCRARARSARCRWPSSARYRTNPYLPSATVQQGGGSGMGARGWERSAPGGSARPEFLPTHSTATWNDRQRFVPAGWWGAIDEPSGPVQAPKSSSWDAPAQLLAVDAENVADWSGGRD